MFRFTEWQEQGHDFRQWRRHFEERAVRTEVRPCAHGMVARPRLADGAMTSDSYGRSGPGSETGAARRAKRDGSPAISCAISVSPRETSWSATAQPWPTSAHQG